MIEKQDLQKILGVIEARWPSAGDRIKSDPEGIRLWWRTLKNHRLPDLMAVLDRIAAGDLPRPYDTAFLATLNRESNRLHRERARAARPRPIDLIQRDCEQAEQDRRELQALEARYGAELDSLPLPELVAMTERLLGGFASKRIQEDRQNPLVRPCLLVALAENVHV